MMLPRRWTPLFLPVLAAGCVDAHGQGDGVGGQEQARKLQEKMYTSILEASNKQGGTRPGCGVVGFELDDQGRASGYKVFYSVPDVQFAQGEIGALSAVRFPPEVEPRRRVIAMSHGVLAGCSLQDVKQAAHQALSEGYSDQWVVEDHTK